jgi:hypothetical protein
VLKNGSYSAWFKTPQGQGTGIVHFENGKISGGDSIMTYDGSYQVAGDRFTADGHHEAAYRRACDRVRRR